METTNPSTPRRRRSDGSTGTTPAAKRPPAREPDAAPTMGPHLDLGQLNEFVYQLHYKQEAHMKGADELASVVTYNAQYAEGTYRGAGELGGKVETIRVDHNKTKDEMTQMKDQLAKNDEQVAQLLEIKR